MTERINGVLVIKQERPQQCDLCGQIDELRPYGPGGAKICYPCGMKDPINTFMAYARVWSDGMDNQEDFLTYVKMRIGDDDPGFLMDHLEAYNEDRNYPAN